ncbi:DUF1768-domain-containing protein [Athelia psychrophila]|uniref:DUF1768-domain-containing protein n=1 Tax=Athelia psychrophila TaxID=1759441 RepID=A0A167UUS9_9AGAM|nr:DUF1768-domain-containing protein [Fibularhizoctonia sp. CBS 109695]KZP06328.1 DUF1768-domain-containing protein [Fibularhizoctonia sp. CBS 109695]
MSSRSSPITVVTSPTGEISPDKPSPPIPFLRAAGPSIQQYRIEEHRRTIFLTSSVPPGKWDTKALNELLTLADPEDPSAEAQPLRQNRSKSLNEDDLVAATILEDANQKARISPSSSPRAHRYSRNLVPPKIGGGSSSTPTTPITARGGSPRFPLRNRILFYNRRDPHYGFTNFSAHPVVYKGKSYPTSEHLFQSHKFQDHRPNLAEHIRTCSDRPSVAFAQARRFQPEVRPDWMKVNIQKMDETLWYKFTQHSDLKEELLATGEAELVEDSDKDAFWGCGADRRGRNELGKALERLRALLREA